MPTTVHEERMENDYSLLLRGLRGGALANAAGLDYQAFKRTLAPRYGRVLLDVLTGYAGLALLVGGMLALEAHAPAAAMAACLPAACALGFAMSYMQLFLHEAAHHNLAPGRRLNDWISHLFITWFLGTAVHTYRPVHWDHHRHLGTAEDPERSYFQPLGWKQVLGLLAGVRVVQVMRLRFALGRARGGQPNPYPLFTALVNGAIMAAAWWAGFPVLVATWALALASFFPFWCALRQLLEHRDPAMGDARGANGPTSRLFGDGLFARAFGGAGFNRHLLHHLEPQVPYTRLAELEAYLMETELAPLLARHRTTYGRTVRDLWR